MQLTKSLTSEKLAKRAFYSTALQSLGKNVKLTSIMNDHAGRKYRCGREMRNNGFSWSGLN